MPIAKVGDINLYYEVHGKGEPLVLIMGYTLRGGQFAFGALLPHRHLDGLGDDRVGRQR